MKTVASAVGWLLMCAILVLSSVAYAQGWVQIEPPPVQLTADLEPQVQIASPQTPAELGEVVLESADARVHLVHNFLKRYNSPLLNEPQFAETLVSLADEHDIDFRLLPSIAMQESTLCKAIPEGSYNCLGLGVHARGTWKFESYEENFRAAARILKNNYIDQGLTTPEQIMRKYTPSSNGSWAASVNQWMAEMRYDDRQLGRTLKEDADLLEFVSEPSPEPSESKEL